MTINRSLLASLQQYQKTHDKAVQLFGLFEDANPAELLRVQKELGALASQLIEGAGLEWGQCGSLGRHLRFLSYYLERNDKQSCHEDARDIVFYDLPATLRSVIAGSTHEQYLDEKLRDSVYPLLDGGHYDSAIRKTFVVLTDRLRRAFGVTDEVDGATLVNQVFGNSGKIHILLENSKKQALRDLISGFYGVYRNRYSHNDTEAQFGGARAIIEMANQILAEIEAVADASAQGYKN